MNIKIGRLYVHLGYWEDVIIKISIDMCTQEVHLVLLFFGIFATWDGSVDDIARDTLRDVKDELKGNK